MTKYVCALLVLSVCVACSSGTPGNSTPSGQQQAVPAAPATQSPAGEPGAASQSAAVPASDRTLAAAPGAAVPTFREVTLPAGTAMNLTLETPVSSDGSKAEDVVRAKLAKAIVVDGDTVVPAGADVVGTVLDAKESGRVKGLATVSFRFNRLTSGNESENIRTTRITRQAQPTKGEDAKKVGIGAGAGALIGAIAGGKKGAAIGAGVGAGAGTGAVLATKGDEVRLGAGAAVRATLEDAVKITVPIKQ